MMTLFWMAQGRLEFDRSGFRAICAREGLLGAAQNGVRVFGVKSFEHAFDRLEERCHEVLDLIPAFDERYIRSDNDWESTLYPALRTFLLGAAKDQLRLRLALDAHVTLAFAAGSIINIKSGRHVELEQRGVGRRPARCGHWRAGRSSAQHRDHATQCRCADVAAKPQANAVGQHDLDHASSRRFGSERRRGWWRRIGQARRYESGGRRGREMAVAGLAPPGAQQAGIKVVPSGNRADRRAGFVRLSDNPQLLRRTPSLPPRLAVDDFYRAICHLSLGP